jgi:hypothetical protein
MNFFEQLGRYAANTIIKQAEEEEGSGNKSKKKPSAAEKIVDTNSAGGIAADYLAPGLWGGERAGRTQAMADSIGEPTTFGVKHPLSSSWMHLLGGGGLGAAGGAGAGALAALLLGARRPDIEGGAALGAGLGGLLGGGAGLYSAGKSRRDEMKRINHFYDEDSEAGRVDPKDPKFSLLSALLLPGRGPHRTGQLEAVKAMKGGDPIKEQHTGMRDALYASRGIPYLGTLMNPLHGYAQNIRTQMEGTEPVEQNAPPMRRGRFVA